MQFHREPSGDECKLNMTPMIDVVFQLLIFFMVGCKFRVPEGELEAYLPEEGAPRELHKRVEEVDEIRITLRVSQAGATNPEAAPSVLLDGKRVGGTGAGGMAWLHNHLQTLAADKQVRDEVPIIIEAEPDLAYRWVIHVLNLCRRERFKKVNFAASKRGAPLPSGAKKP